jgi:hypothetical protein
LFPTCTLLAFCLLSACLLLAGSMTCGC